MDIKYNMKDLDDNSIDVVIVGNIAYDINTFPNREKGKTKIVINNGGAGYYSLIPASLYTKVGIVARIGNDFDIKNLKNKNIDLSGLKNIKEYPTTKFHHTYLSSDGQTRTFRPEVYDDCMIKIDDFPKEYFNAKYIHIATNFPSVQKEFIKLIRQNSDALISIDTHEAYIESEEELIKEIFDEVDIAFVDKEFTSLLDCKAPIIIIKKGKTGCQYKSDNLIFESSTVNTTVIDKTGAGDVVTGVFLANMALTGNPKYSLDEAVKIATESIKDYGVDFLYQIKENKKLIKK